MKNFYSFFSGFEKKECPNCHQTVDKVFPKCPNCHEDFSLDAIQEQFKNLTPLGPIKEISVFLFGFLGLQILSLIFQALLVSLTQSILWNGGLTGASLLEAMNRYFQSVDCLTLLNYGTYIIALLILLLFLWKDCFRLLKTFKKKSILWGFLGGLIIFVISYLLTLFLSIWAETSENQETSNAMMASYPVLVTIMSVIFIPFFEEATYRLGLFTFLKRIHPLVAYLGSMIIFGLIHIHDFGSLNEWLNFPVYALGGLCFGFIYDRFGFGASYLAHGTYNLIACIFNLITMFAL